MLIFNEKDSKCQRNKTKRFSVKKIIRYAMIGFAILLIILGLLIKHAKFYFLIAGYNTLDKEEKSKIKIEEIASLFRNIFLAMAIVIICGYLLANWIENKEIKYYFFWTAILTGIPYLLIKSNSKKYKTKL